MSDGRVLFTRQTAPCRGVDSPRQTTFTVLIRWQAKCTGRARMSARFPAAVVTAVLATTSSLAARQPSLVNLAAKEGKRRQAVTQAAEIYTNGDRKGAEGK